MLCVVLCFTYLRISRELIRLNNYCGFVTKRKMLESVIYMNDDQVYFEGFNILKSRKLAIGLML